jgi:hypothetical protein
MTALILMTMVMITVTMVIITTVIQLIIVITMATVSITMVTVVVMVIMITMMKVVNILIMLQPKHNWRQAGCQQSSLTQAYGGLPVRPQPFFRRWPSPVQQHVGRPFFLCAAPWTRSDQCEDATGPKPLPLLPPPQEPLGSLLDQR